MEVSIMEDTNYDRVRQLMGPFDSYIEDCGITA